MAGAILVGSSATALAKDNGRVVTDVFAGKASTGAGLPLPVNIDPNPAHIIVRSSDGAYGLAYTYDAAGPATGDIQGSFTYDEHGHLYFLNPADPRTFAGSTFESGVFAVTGKHGHTYTIADAQPATYQHGVNTVAAGKGFAAHVAKEGKVDQGQSDTTTDLSQMLKKLGLLPSGGSLTYGYFTFTDDVGTFTGYATPDFRQFAIQVGFHPGAGHENDTSAA